MKIQKRDGRLVAMKFDKITQRLKNLMTTDMKKVIDVEVISQKVIDSLYDGIKSIEIDTLVSETAVGMSTVYPEYEELAARVVASYIRKRTPGSFSDAMYKLFEAGIVSESLWNAIETIGRSTVNEAIVPTRDMHINYFGLKTLERSYLQTIDGELVETPQYMWMRVAMGIHGEDWERAKETYDAMSQGYFTHATPTLFNSGTPRSQLSSCFLIASKNDSIDGIYDTLKECAQISKWSGGIGLHIHNIRAAGSKIKGTNGISDGIVPMLRVFNNTARYVNQGGGKRKGSFAIYLEPWHGDIEAFLDLRLNQGEEEMRCRDLFTALWIPDLFMERVQQNGKWSLFSPSDLDVDLSDLYGDKFREAYEKAEREGKAVKTVDAHHIWNRIIRSQVETGTPYMLYKDAVNRKNNQANLGTIKSSNLCVAPETKILTSTGYHAIKDLVGQEVEVWNGEEFSPTTVVQTGTDQPLLTVKTSGGYSLRCTPYHKFHVKQKDKVYHTKNIDIVEAKDLTTDMCIIKHDLPIINYGPEFPRAYTHGFFCADGTTAVNCKTEGDLRCRYKAKTNGFCLHHQDNEAVYEEDGERCRAKLIKTKKYVDLYHNKKELLQYIEYETVSTSICGKRMRCSIPDDVMEKYTVPMNYSLTSKLEWLAGYLDGDGCVVRHTGGHGKSIQVASIHKEFLNDVRLMLQTLGCPSRLGIVREESKRMMPDGKGTMAEYNCKKVYRLCISSAAVENLLIIGFSPKRLNLSNSVKGNRSATHYEQIVSVEDKGEKDDTYCFNEPKRHMGVFNGILTGNCSEVVLYTSKDETAVCNLASIALPKFVNAKTKKFDFSGLEDTARMITRNLNRVIDINFYPTENAKRSNMRHRPIGIGVQGLADAYILMGYPFDSEEAKALNSRIFETMYYGAVSESVELAKVHGAYESFKGSPASQGKFQFDLWENDKDLHYDWDSLRKSVVEHGLRNSMFLSPMPTASTSQILGNNEAIEPYTSNMYLRRTLAGEFVVINKHLIKDLVSLGIWNVDTKNAIIRDNGSVQGLDIPDDLKAKYKTVWEISQKVLIDQSADRGRFICQTQSLNLFLEEPNTSKISSMHMYAWSKGLKTGMYYLRTRPKARAVKFTVDPTEVARMACSLKNRDECTMCSA